MNVMEFDFHLTGVGGTGVALFIVAVAAGFYGQWRLEIFCIVLGLIAEGIYLGTAIDRYMQYR